MGRRLGVLGVLLVPALHAHLYCLSPLRWLGRSFLEAYPTRRFQSAWMGIIVHSAQSVFVIAVVLALVL